MVHQVLLHNKESRHQTGHQTFSIIKLFVYFNNLFELCIMCRSTTFSRGTRRDTRLFLIINDFIYLFESSIRCRFTMRSRGSRRDTRLFTLFIILFILFIIVYSNCASGAAPQQPSRRSRSLVSCLALRLPAVERHLIHNSIQFK